MARPQRRVPSLFVAVVIACILRGCDFAFPGSGRCGADPIGLNAVYLHFGWGDPPDPVDVMAATNIKQFTFAFILSDGECSPLWDGSRALNGAIEQTQIDKIRANGGDVVVSFGGSSGDSLGENCSSASALAAAYQTVISAYQLNAIDIDIEGKQLFESATVRQRVVDALKIVQKNNPSIKIYVTFGTTPTGPYPEETDLIQRAAMAGLDVTGWTGMPFWFDSHTGPMASVSITAIDALKNSVMSAYDYDCATAYRHIGISSNNGKVAGKPEETVALADFNTMLGYAQRHHIARFTFWAVNRDRQCGGLFTDIQTNCSGISQSPYAFTQIIAGYCREEEER